MSDTSDKTSPRPWHPETRETKTVIWSAGENLAVGSVHKEADAELIVRAVNSHDELVAALQRMLAVQAALMPGVKYIAVADYAELNEAPIAARAALRKAGAL